MVGKVVEISKILGEGDTLARDISEKYDQWGIQREEKIEDVKELRDYIFATDTSTTSNAALPWKNSTTIPKICQIRDNLHANYMAALFPTDTWFKWEAHSEDAADKQKANIIEAYISNKLRESGFIQTVGKVLYDWIDTGNAFGEVIFVNEQKTDPDTGETIQGYIGPKLVRTSLYDHVFNPTAVDYNHSPKITRYVKSLGEIEDDANTRPGMEYLRDVLDKLKSRRKLLAEFKDSDLDKAEGYIADGFGSLREYYESGLVEILEFEGDLYDRDSGQFHKDRVITVVDRSWVARNEPNPSWLGRSPRAHSGWRERPDNIYAMGPLDNLVGLQYRLDHLENLKADALDLTIHPPVVIQGDVQPFTWQPLEQIHIADGDGAVTLLPPNSAAFQVNNEIMLIMQLMEEMAGAPKEAMGIRTPGEKTAFEVSSLQNAAGRIFQDKISKFEREFIEPTLNIYLEMARRNIDGADLVRIMDDDYGILEFIKITKEDITAAGKLRPIGARHYAAQAQLIQNMNGVFNSNLYEIIKPHVSSENLAKAVEEIFAWEKYKIFSPNIAVSEQANTQRLANAAQEQVDVEAVTPVEPQAGEV